MCTIYFNPNIYIVKKLKAQVLMPDDELGLNTFIERDDAGAYICADANKIIIDEKPIAITKVIVCRGTTCYIGTQPGQRSGDVMRYLNEIEIFNTDIK